MKRHVNIRLWLLVWVMLVLFSLIRNVTRSDRIKLRAPVIETHNAAQFFYSDSIRPTIANYKHARIGSIPEIEIIKPSLLVKMTAPADRFHRDTVYCFLILVTSILCIIKLRNVNLNAPFSKRLGSTTKLVAYIILLFGVINYLRILWFDLFIRNLTDNNYYYTDHLPFLLSAELWIGLILLRIGQLIEKREVLQSDQNLMI